MIAAANATERLRQLLSENEFTIERSGKDQYGRTLAKLRIKNTTAGEIMTREGLVRRWKGHRESWC
ncbi:MAG: thermonuclease family protein [Ahrensia sp.]|nr:thermonuclease family protein [Ahrensia sp.]